MADDWTQLENGVLPTVTHWLSQNTREESGPGQMLSERRAQHTYKEVSRNSTFFPPQREVISQGTVLGYSAFRSSN